MIDNLFDFGKVELEEEKTKDADKNNDFCKNDKIDEEKAKNIYEKYKNYSKNELINELHSVISNGKKNGTITNQKINDTVKNLMPYLNDNQKEFLESIIKGINE